MPEDSGIVQTPTVVIHSGSLYIQVRTISSRSVLKEVAMLSTASVNFQLKGKTNNRKSTFTFFSSWIAVLRERSGLCVRVKAK
jgi:hypothetical protein